MADPVIRLWMTIIQKLWTPAVPGDTISAGGGCEAATITRVRGAAWGKFRKVLPILSCKTLFRGTLGRIFNTCQECNAVCWQLLANEEGSASAEEKHEINVMVVVQYKAG